MLTEFINASMEKARYELLEWWEWYYAEIPWFAWVWANSGTLEWCRKELQDILEEWILLKVRKKLFIPTVNKYNLNELLCEK
jgi:hypothetical protein